LFKADYGSFIYKYPVNNENYKFIEQFIPLLHHAGAEFGIHDIRNGTVNFKRK